MRCCSQVTKAGVAPVPRRGPWPVLPQASCQEPYITIPHPFSKGRKPQIPAWEGLSYRLQFPCSPKEDIRLSTVMLERICSHQGCRLCIGSLPCFSLLLFQEGWTALPEQGMQAARTSALRGSYWAEAVGTACREPCLLGPLPEVSLSASYRLALQEPSLTVSPLRGTQPKGHSSIAMSIRAKQTFAIPYRGCHQFR